MLSPCRSHTRASAWASYEDDSRPWVHLLDSGIADNIGIRALSLAFAERGEPWSIIERPKLRGLGLVGFFLTARRLSGLPLVSDDRRRFNGRRYRLAGSILALEERIVLENTFQFLVEFDGRKLQQPNRLLQLGRQGEVLGEAEL